MYNVQYWYIIMNNVQFWSEHYNTIILSAIIPDSLLEGTRGHEVAEVLYVIIHSGFDWKGCNVIRAHDTI